MFELKDFLYEADTIIPKVGDLTIIPFGCPENKAVLSSKTVDGGVMFSITSKEDYNIAEFAFRDWSVISGMLSSFKGVDNLNIKLETKEEDGIDYPSRLIFESPVATVNHFLQRYPAISKSPIIAKQYKERKLQIKVPPLTELAIDESVYNELNRVAGIINKKSFHIEKISGNYYYCFGDMGSKSTDFAKILMNTDINFTVDTGRFYPISVLLAIIKALNFKCRVGVFKGYLFIVGETEHTNVCISMAGKISD